MVKHHGLGMVYTTYNHGDDCGMVYDDFQAFPVVSSCVITSLCESAVVVGSTATAYI